MPNGFIGFILSAKDRTKKAFTSASSRLKRLGNTAKNISGKLRGMAGSFAAPFKAIGKMAGRAGLTITRSIGRATLRAARVGTIAIAGMATGLVVAMHKAQDFNKRMAQVATLGEVDLKKMKSQVRGLSAEFGLAKDALTQGLYAALSAGVPANNAMEFLTVAAKTAVGGATDTATAVDILTTALNAYGRAASEAEAVSDVLNTGVVLGKTTIVEMAGALFQVAPMASAMGVSLEEVTAALASLTKQGTPTSVAMTQIRGAMIAMTKNLGDGWAATMTLQDGMKALNKMAGGSQNALRKLTGRIEGAMGVLALTGTKAKGAASDLKKVMNSAGAMDRAFNTMSLTNPLDKLQQAIGNIGLTIGAVSLDFLAPSIELAAKKAAVFAEQIAKISDGDKFKELKSAFSGFTSELLAGGDRSEVAFRDLKELLKDSFGGAMLHAVGILKKGALAAGALFRDGVIKKPIQDIAAYLAVRIEARRQLMQEGNLDQGGDQVKQKKAMDDRIASIQAGNALMNLPAGGGEDALKTFADKYAGKATEGDKAVTKVAIAKGAAPTRQSELIARMFLEKAGYDMSGSSLGDKEVPIAGPKWRTQKAASLRGNEVGFGGYMDLSRALGTEINGEGKTMSDLYEVMSDVKKNTDGLKGSQEQV